MANCPAPKFTTLSTEAGIPVAVCLYHEIKTWDEEKRDERAKELTGEDWETVQEAYNKTQGENQ